MKRIGIITVNRNNRMYTGQLIEDLLRQSCSNFDLLICDNGSTEDASDIYKRAISLMDSYVFYSSKNVPLNHLWNMFSRMSKHEFLCLMNNDIEISYNVVRDILYIMDKDPEVGIVCHATNHPVYLQSKHDPKYRLFDGMKCGWLFTIRRKLWKEIPHKLKWFCGDDWIYDCVYEAGYKVAIAQSSPIIHYQGRTIGELGDDHMQKMYDEIAIYQSLGKNWNLTSDIPSILKMHLTTPLLLEK